MIDFVIVMATIFTFFILPVYVFAAWKERNKRKQELSRNLAEKSLTTAELESMIGDIVRSAMTEVEDRLAVGSVSQLGITAEIADENGFVDACHGGGSIGTFEG